MNANQLSRIVYIAFGVFLATIIAAIVLKAPRLGYVGMVAYAAVLGLGLAAELMRNMTAEVRQGRRLRVLGVALFSGGVALAFAAGFVKFFPEWVSWNSRSQSALRVSLLFILAGLLLVFAEVCSSAISRNLKQRRTILASAQGTLLLVAAVAVGYYILRFVKLLL